MASLVTQVRVGFESPTSHQHLSPLRYRATNAGGTTWTLYPEDPGSNPGGSTAVTGRSSAVERECFTNTCRCWID